MKANMGKIDRILRVGLGITILSAGFFFQSWWGAIGIIPLITATISICPLYSIFGWNTCPVKNKAA